MAKIVTSLRESISILQVKKSVWLVVFAAICVLNGCNSKNGETARYYEEMSKENLESLDAQGDFTASLQLGRIAWREHRYEDAAQYFYKATASQDLEIRKIALFNTGLSQAEDQSPDAVCWFGKSADSGYAPAQGVYAACLIKNGKLREGYDYAQKSISQNNAWGYYALAQYYSNLSSVPGLLDDEELPRENDLIRSDRGFWDNMHKSAMLGNQFGFYMLITAMTNRGCSNQEIMEVINHYKDKYPQMAQDLTEIIAGDYTCKEENRWKQGWILLDDMVR